MIDTDKYEGHTPAPWKLDDRIKEMFLGLEADVAARGRNCQRPGGYGNDSTHRSRRQWRGAV